MTTEAFPNPTNLRDFLKGQGWLLIKEAIRDRLFVLENTRWPLRQLSFPIDAGAADYRDSVDSVLEKYQELSGIERSSLLQRVRCVNDDVLRLRVFQTRDDTALPLGFAASFVSNAERLIRSAASTVLHPRAHHPRLSFSEAAQLVEKSRFGQTEAGSYVIRIECPINAMSVQSSVLEAKELPFVRKVTSTMQVALFQLVTAIEEDKLDRFVSDLKKSSTPMVSANLCEAILGMHDELVDNSLDISVDWSPQEPVPFDTPQRVRIQKDYFARIDEVQRELRSVETLTEDAYVGTVERLEGEIGEDGRRAGLVMLSLVLPDEDEKVRVRVSLSADDYERADKAHMSNGAYVAVHGRLRPGRQPRQLTDVTAFSMLNL